MSSNGYCLYRYSAVGKVASGHQAPIICLNLFNDSRGRQNLITGSKDHLIKLFDLSNEQSASSPIQPKFTLDPPHYDGVQCFAHRGDTLFSGSRDMCIKKWDLSEPTTQPLVFLLYYTCLQCSSLNTKNVGDWLNLFNYDFAFQEFCCQSCSVKSTVCKTFKIFTLITLFKYIKSIAVSIK